MPHNESDFLVFIRLLVNGSVDEVAARLAADPALATARCESGATRQDAASYFLADIRHYLYRGDTALHIAAAAFRSSVARLLIDGGAGCAAKNRRGAEPLHYAADTHHWDPAGQARTIKCLTSSGASPNAVDRSGVAPLHRAVRTRSVSAVRALLEAGANPRQPNHSGSMPLHLAVQTTGRGGAGSARARQQQTAIIRMLLRHGATLADRDGHGRTALAATSSAWVRRVLVEAAG